MVESLTLARNVDFSSPPIAPPSPGHLLRHSKNPRNRARTDPIMFMLLEVSTQLQVVGGGRRPTEEAKEETEKWWQLGYCCRQEEVEEAEGERKGKGKGKEEEEARGAGRGRGHWQRTKEAAQVSIDRPVARSGVGVAVEWPFGPSLGRFSRRNASREMRCLVRGGF